MQRELVVVVDCRDPARMVAFWTAALGYRKSGQGGPYVSLVPSDGDGPELLLQRVPEPKVTKNRLHLDIRVADMRAEAQRLERLGARRLHDEPLVERGWRWFVLADPEGNEFCCIQPPGS
ncbi:VOC family protein [soil metagenome]